MSDCQFRRVSEIAGQETSNVRKVWNEGVYGAIQLAASWNLRPPDPLVFLATTLRIRVKSVYSSIGAD